MKPTTLLLSAAYLAIFTVSDRAAAQPAPATGAEAYIWDLDSHYPTPEAWNADRARVLEGIKAMGRMRGLARSGPADLANVMDRMRATRGLAGKMARFGLLSSQVDSNSDVARARFDAGTQLEIEVEAVATLLESDIRALGATRIADWARREPRLRAVWHTHRLDRIFTEAKYDAPPQNAALLAAMTRWPRTTSDVYDSLTGTGVDWPTIPGADGKPIALSIGRYRSARRNPSAEVRKAAAKAYHGSLDGHEATLGLLFSRRIEADLAMARARGFDNSMDAALARSDDLAPGASLRLIEAARRHKAISQRYARLVGRAFGSPQGSYDQILARSPWPFTNVYTMQQAIELVVEANAPMGPDHQRRLAQHFKKPWFHFPPGDSKSSSAGHYFQVGGGNPYAIMTYTGNLVSLRTLGSISQALMSTTNREPGDWPDRREEDQPVYGNGRWSLGHFMVDDLLMQRAGTGEQRAGILLDQLNRLWSDFFYYAAMTELENWVMQRVQRGEPPTGAQISAQHLKLAREYNGHDSGGLSIDEVYAREWMIESELFHTHHQATFAAAAASAAAMAEGLAERDPKILALLRDGRGGNLEYSNDFLLAMGIDFSTAAPYEALARRMTSKLDQLEAELQAMGR